MEYISVSFTGHRPDKLPGKYNWNAPQNIKLMEKIREICVWLLEGNPDQRFVFYFGGALGVDQMAFEVCRKLREEYPNRLRLIVAVPFADQPIKWEGKEDLKRYKSQLKQADFIVHVDILPDYDRVTEVPEGKYHVEKMQIRNEFMIDHSDLTIGVFDGSKGGTKNCVDYAKKKGNELILIHPKTLKVSCSFYEF